MLSGRLKYFKRSSPKIKAEKLRVGAGRGVFYFLKRGTGGIWFQAGVAGRYSFFADPGPDKNLNADLGPYLDL